MDTERKHERRWIEKVLVIIFLCYILMYNYLIKNISNNYIVPTISAWLEKKMLENSPTASFSNKWCCGWVFQHFFLYKSVWNALEMFLNWEI